jgi:3-phosphoshikimate 1-carboxyvinyltransferase
MFSAIAVGKSRISGLLEGEDVLRTAEALRMSGVDIVKSENGDYIVSGVSTRGLQEPENVLDLGNAGTSARLLMGLFAPYDFNVFFTGDASLTARPMERVRLPLSQMGVEFWTRSKTRLPLMMRGSSTHLMPISYTLPLASAQVKSAILIAGISLNGTTDVIETEPTRNHTEIMLKNMGADVQVLGDKIRINGGKELSCGVFDVPGDPSSAAFLVVASLISKNSHILVKNVCLNPTRAGFFEVLVRMKAKIKIINERIQNGEVIADIEASDSLGLIEGIDLEAQIAPRMIDEYPILFVLCVFAKGKSVLRGLKELITKESNRLKIMADGLAKNGSDLCVDEDNFALEINGNGGEVLSNPTNSESPIATHLDHRIAMSFLILGLNSLNPVKIDSPSPISTSFPNFFELMQLIGVKMFD